MRKEPQGADLLKNLLELYAEQVGVKITYETQKSTEGDAAYLEQQTLRRRKA